MYGLGIAKPLRYSYSADLLDLQRLLDGRSVLDNFFSKQSTKGALKAGIGHIPSKLFSKNLQPFKLQVYSKYKKNQMCPYTSINYITNDLELLRPWGPQSQLSGGNPRFKPKV